MLVRTAIAAVENGVVVATSILSHSSSTIAFGKLAAGLIAARPSAGPAALPVTHRAVAAVEDKEAAVLHGYQRELNHRPDIHWLWSGC